MLKLIATTAIISLGIAGAYFIVHNSISPLSNTNPIEIKSAGNNVVTGMPKIEQLSSKTITVNNTEENNTGSLNQTSTNSENNLTAFMTRQLAQKIAEQNPTGPQTADGEKWISAPNAESITNDLIMEAANKFTSENFFPDIKDSDLKISKDNSKEALKLYLISIQEIIKNSSNENNSYAQKTTDTPTNENSEELSVAYIKQLIITYKKIIEEIYNLSVPSLALEIQKTEIKLLSEKKNILEKILDYKTDPVTAILAAKELENLDKQFSDLKDMVIKFIEINSLNS